MKPRSPRLRAAAAAFTVLQLLGAAVWPVVDARLEAAERNAIAHIEAERATPCAPGHDDFFCRVCRTVSIAGHTPASAIGLFESAPALRVAQAQRSVIAQLQTLSPAHGPRAPPIS